MGKHKLQPARGTKDIIGDEYRVFRHVVDAARSISSRYGFEEMVLPIFEFTEVYKRTLGDVSDIVTKEMYSFEDRGGEGITLRPEFTAGVVRLVMSNGLTQQTPLKLFTHGPLFRYERPQKGRYRQFNQLNFECFGVSNPSVDAEIIAMGAHLIEKLGLGEDITLEINSLGDNASRDAYREALITYFSGYKGDLSEDSLKRLEKNPLRILDSKDEKDKEIVVDAPKMSAFYTNEAKSFFDSVLQGLENLDVAYQLNDRLVRGLDYYSHTAFEFTTQKLGAQNAVLAGGRYDALSKMMGGPELPAIGFAGGIERICALLENKIALDKLSVVAIICIGDVAEGEGFKLAHQLRKEGFNIDLAYSGNVGKRMKRADKIGAKAAIIIGEDELKNRQVVLRDLTTGTEDAIALEKLYDRIACYK